MSRVSSLWRRQSSTARGLVAIMAGTAAGQVLGLLAAPILSRLYSPSDFGVFSIISAMAITLGTVTALRLELAVPLPASDDDARAILAMGGVFCFLSGIVLAVVFWFASSELATLFRSPNLEAWVLAVPVLAVLFGLFRLLNQWALRAGRFVATARRNVLSAATTVAVQITADWKGAGTGGLVVGIGAGQAAGALSLLWGSRIRGSVRITTMTAMLNRYRRFALVLAPSGLVNAAGIYLPLLLVGVAYGPAAAGWLGFTQRILATPMTLVGQSVAQVYLSELARTRRQSTEREAQLFWGATKRLSAVGLLGAATLLMFGPWIFSTVFGHQWRTSGDMARALSVLLAAQLVASTLSQTLVVLERTRTQLAWDVGRLILTAGAVVACWQLGLGLLVCVWVLSVSSALAYAISWELSRRAVRAIARQH